MAGDLVRGARAAQQHQLGREVPDPGQLPELREGLLRGQGAQPGGVEAAVQGGDGEGAEPLRLAARQSGEPVQRDESLRGRERRQRPAAEGDGLAELAGHPRLDRGRLPDADPSADDGPGGGLVRGPEADRAQARVAPLQPGHDRVALAHGREPGPVHVQRQDPRDLLCAPPPAAPARCGRADDLPRHAVGLLAHPHPDRLPGSLHREGQLQRLPRAPVERGRREALEEPGAGGQRERPPHRQHERAHRARAGVRPAAATGAGAGRWGTPSRRAAGSPPSSPQP